MAWTMWDAPSDRDYLEQFNPPEPDDEEPDEDYPFIEEPELPDDGAPETRATEELPDQICPF